MRLRKRRYSAVLLPLRQLDRTGKIVRFISAFVALSFLAAASPIVTSMLDASLDTGSLAGVTFPVSFSYDAGQVQPVGDSFISLVSFDFVLLGVPFNRSEIFQGGQVIFRDGRLENVTASYQVFLPPMSPVENITFGFGGPRVIGYIDCRSRKFHAPVESITSTPLLNHVKHPLSPFPG